MEVGGPANKAVSFFVPSVDRPCFPALHGVLSSQHDVGLSDCPLPSASDRGLSLASSEAAGVALRTTDCIPGIGPRLITTLSGINFGSIEYDRSFRNSCMHAIPRGIREWYLTWYLIEQQTLNAVLIVSLNPDDCTLERVLNEAVQIQNPLRATSCGFESHHRYYFPGNDLRRFPLLRSASL